MRCRRWLARSLATACLALAPSALQAADLYSQVKIPGQVRENDPWGGVEAPFLVYSDMGIAGLRHGVNAETYWRLYEDFGPDRGGGDFYAGVMRAPGAIPYVSELSLGRQFLSEGPRGGNLADAGRITLDPGGPVAASFFGGQPRYFEPTYGVPSVSQDEQMFGTRLELKKLRRGYLNAGFLQHIRDGNTLSQLVTLNAGRSYPEMAGMPNFYGSFAYDAHQQLVNHTRAGVQAVLLSPRLHGNFEFTYYNPNEQTRQIVQNPDLREDPLFQVFSISDQLRFAGSLRYILGPTLSTFANLSYQRYENSPGVHTNGYVGGGGLQWLPEGDGLESVRLEYYVADSRGGILNGGRLYYDNWVYDRIHFRTKVDVAYYEKITNQNDTAVATLLGLGYDVLPGLYCEVYMEGNRNERFDADVRFGLYVVYSWFHRTTQKSAPGQEGA